MKLHRRFRIVALILTFAFTFAAASDLYAQGWGYRKPGKPAGVRFYEDPAYKHGFDDGYRRGVDAARSGDRHQARRDRWYRDAERGYDRRYGSRAQWRQVYRDGFERGYDRGYREARRRW